MKTKNLLPDNYAANVLCNWMKKIGKFEELTDKKQLDLLESLHPVNESDKVTFSDALEYKDLTGKQKYLLMDKAADEGRPFKKEGFHTVDVTAKYGSLTISQKIKYLLVKVPDVKNENINIGAARVSAFFEFMKQYENIETLLDFLNAENIKAETAIAEAENRTETETETETAPQK